MVWSQIYDPLGNPWLSTLVAALPVIVLLGGLGVFRMKAHTAALLGLVALASAVFVFRMPAEMAGKTALLGAAFGLLPIGWIFSTSSSSASSRRSSACSRCSRTASAASPMTGACSSS